MKLVPEPVICVAIYVKRFTVLCVPERTARGSQRPYLKMCPPYVQFYVRLTMSMILGNFVRKSFESKNFEDAALNADTKNSNLQLLLGATDFAKFLGMEDFRHYELHKAMQCKKGLDSDQ